MTLLTVGWLRTHGACEDGVTWFTAQSETAPVAVLRALMQDKKLNWANWLIVRVMTKKQYVAYAIYAAEQVIELYEKHYPNDPRPRQAINAAKAYMKKPTARATGAAARAARAARAAAWAAEAAGAAGATGAAMQKKILTYGLTLLERT